MKRLAGLGLFILVCVPVIKGQSLLSDLQLEHNPVKRSELALNFAGDAFDDARNYYLKGDIKKGDAQLEDMTSALKECVTSLDTAHKGKFYKKAEMKVAALQRRLDGILSNIDLQERGWAEFTQRKLEEIHEALLAGVMKK